jgi:hypothetical protein
VPMHEGRIGRMRSDDKWRHVPGALETARLTQGRCTPERGIPGADVMKCGRKTIATNRFIWGSRRQPAICTSVLCLLVAVGGCRSKAPHEDKSIAELEVMLPALACIGIGFHSLAGKRPFRTAKGRIQGNHAH